MNLSIDSPGITVVLGFNGAGKSLLLRLLHGLIEPTAGTVLWAGKPLNDKIRRRQAMVFQKPVLLRRSVIENINFALATRGIRNRDRCELVLEQAGLSAIANRPARLLSGGEQQRLALARALAVEPEVLFLDEPSANLDPSSVNAIENNVLEASRKGTKIIFVTHELSQAQRLADDIVFLHRGKATEHGEADRFFSNPASKEAIAYLEGRLFI
ncbi:MAG: ATP-binding cassette domain-containing protein [Pseudomonadota bacterium]